MNNIFKIFKTLIEKISLHIPLSEKMLFVKHLSIMIKAGMPLLDSLWLLRKQARSKSFQKIISGLIVDIDNGQFLSVGLEKYASIFGDFFINIIRVGEASGTLADNLNYLHKELWKSYELRKKVRSAMTYPIIVLVAAGGISFILIFFIFPKIIPIFTSFRMELPLPTRMLIGFVSIFTAYGVWILVGFLFFIIAAWFSFQIKKVRFIFHRFLLSLPYIGKVSQNINMTAFARTLSVLLKSGIKIVDAVMIVSDTVPNLVFQKKIKLVAERIKSGELMSSYMTENSQFFPPIFSQMVEVGESTGHLDENLNYLADFYESEVDETFKNISTILEPMLLLLMGIVVGFIVLAVITPIYGFTQNLKIR